MQWQWQPARRGRRWDAILRVQRASIAHRLQRTPSLRQSLADPDWCQDAWHDALAKANEATGLSDFPRHCPWPMENILDPDWKNE